MAAQFSNGKGACFDGADLTKASVDHSSNCSFKNAKLHEANVYVANDCCFDGADLTGANINTVSDCSFKKAICRNMTVNPHSYLYRRGPAKVVNDFTGADLSAACLANASLGGSIFQGASLQGADLRRCDLSKADLSKADLSGAYLAGADLSGAVLTGADFSDANVQGATFDGANTSEAKNLIIAQQISATVGPNLKELDKLSKKANNIKAGATVELDDGQVTLSVDGASQYKTYQWQLVRKDGTNDHLHDYDWQGKSYSQVMLELAQFWCTGKLVIESIVAGSSKSPVKGADLRKLVVGAWCEAFGVEAPSEEELKKKKKSQQAGQKEIRDELIEELKSRGGVKKFNARTDAEVLAAGHFRNADFAGRNLSGVKLPSMDLAGAKFEGAKLNKAQLKGCKCGKANFKNANLDGATLQGGSLTGADLSGASLVKANLSGCSLLRTNFTGANLTSVKLDHLDIAGSNFTDAILKGASFKRASFDETTTFPKGFKYPKDMLWAGKGANPLILQQPKEKVGSLTIEDFMQRMQTTADKSKLGKSLKMLKADRFQLFVQLEDDSLTGVVKSQSDASLVYSCRLRSDGSFCCCTQNLNVCGGLRGSLCKHLLVLIVGLAQSETIDAATVLNWVKSSRAHKPNLDKDAMSETFLRYKGAEAGEIDWRPTETVPEDFYAL